MVEGIKDPPPAPEVRPGRRTRVLLAALVIAEGAVVAFSTVVAGLRALFWVDAAGVIAIVCAAEVIVFVLVAIGLAGGRRWARALAFVLNVLLVALTLAATPSQVRSITLYVELRNRIGPYVDHDLLPYLATGLATWAVLMLLTVAAIVILLRTRPPEPAENA